MPVAAEVYRPSAETDPLSSGDIAYLSLARNRTSGEGPPGEVFDPTGRIPAYPTPALLPLPFGREVAVDTMFGMVVTHSCEIDRQKNAELAPEHHDCRLTVAPIVTEPSVTLIGPGGMDASANWSAIERNDPVASLFLPAIADVSEFAPEVGALPWPRSFADLRGLSTVSRAMVQADRLCSLTPAYLGVLQRQLCRFFTWRDIARHELLEQMVGKRVEAVVPLSDKADRWRVALTTDDGESLTVELRTR